MTLREIQSRGLEALNLATALLQRCRLAAPYAGVFEAADIQWAWRKPRLSDQTQKTFWLDDDGPVAGILLTSSDETDWQIDPVIVPGSTEIQPAMVWDRIDRYIRERSSKTFTIPIATDDLTLTALARNSGLHLIEQDSTGWMNASDCPELITPGDEFTIIDRTLRPRFPHPMRARNGSEISERLAQCSLYDPSLDLSIESRAGEAAGYSLYWFDPVTRVGLVEPVRVHDSYQRKGLARAMLTSGIHRLISCGAERIKVSWETEAAGALYLNVGFQQTSRTNWYVTAGFQTPTASH